MTAILELRNVSFRAGGRLLVDRVCWRINRSEHWSLLGPNGAGKTTLLRLACGYIWPNAGGAIFRLGQRQTDLRRLRRSIGWVTCGLIPKIPRIEPALDTVVSGRFAQFGLRRTLLAEELTAEVIESAYMQLTKLRSEHLADAPFGTLSQGEQQAVLLARARMAEPLLVILDEPCAGLDPGARERFLGHLQDLTSQDDGPGMVMVTHHLEEIMPTFDHTLVLQHGRVLRSGVTCEIVDERLVDTLYGAPPQELVRRNGRVWPIW